MKKVIITSLLLLTGLYSFGNCYANTTFTTYERFNRVYPQTYSNYPRVINKYDSLGNKIGSYVTNRAYNPYRYTNSTYIPTNRVMNRTYYYNNAYNPMIRRYNNSFGGLKSYNRFGQRIR